MGNPQRLPAKKKSVEKAECLNCQAATNTKRIACGHYFCSKCISDQGCELCGMLASIDDTETFVWQLEKELEARTQASQWEKESEERQEYYLHEVLRATQAAKKSFQIKIQDHKANLVSIEKSLAELQREKELVQKQLQMCNTGIFAVVELGRQVTGDAKTTLETFNKHFGNIQIALPSNRSLMQVFNGALQFGNLSTIHGLFKLLDNCPVSGEIFYVTCNPLTSRSCSPVGPGKNCL